MSATDTTVRDAIERSIVGRLLACDESEMMLVDVALTRLEMRRERRPVIAGLRELRDAVDDAPTERGA